MTFTDEYSLKAITPDDELKITAITHCKHGEPNINVCYKCSPSELQQLINQEVRKALDSIEVPNKVKKEDVPFDNTFSSIVKTADAVGRNEAIDEYTANIKEVRAKYEEVSR